MTSDYEKWLDETLNKQVVWTKTARSKLITRDISEVDVKECIAFCEKRKSQETPT